MLYVYITYSDKDNASRNKFSFTIVTIDIKSMNLVRCLNVTHSLDKLQNQGTFKFQLKLISES